jgi:hypothetical protein
MVLFYIYFMWALRMDVAKWLHFSFADTLDLYSRTINCCSLDIVESDSVVRYKARIDNRYLQLPTSIFRD